MTLDPLDPKIEKWLRSLEPRQELIVRFALRTHYPKMRADHANSERIDVLRKKLQLDEDGLAAIIKDARIVAKDIEAVMEPQPVRNTTDRIRKPRR